ncbi:MAG: hypothetical protein AB7S99_05770 [Pseudodonghicola sp.]
MAFKTIMSPANDALYPLRIVEVRIDRGAMVEADALALLAESEDGRRIGISCSQAGRVIQIPPKGALLERRQMILVIETFEEPTRDASAHEASPERTAPGAASDRKDRARPATEADRQPEPAAAAARADAAPDARDEGAAPARKSRASKILIGGAVAAAALAAIYLLAPGSGFTSARGTVAKQTSARFDWKDTPPLAFQASFTLKSEDGADLFDVDVDRTGTVLIAGRIGNRAIICARTFDQDKKGCGPQIELPAAESDPDWKELLEKRDKAGRSIASELSSKEREMLHASATYPTFGFILQHAFPGGDALAGFTPSSDLPTLFYRYNRASQTVTPVDPVAVAAHYTAIARSPRYIALLGDEPQDEDRQALAVFDHAGNSKSLHIARTWIPSDKTRSRAYEDNRTRTFTHVSVTEGEKELSQVDLTGRTPTGIMFDEGIHTRIPFEDHGDALQIFTRASSQTYDAETVLPERDLAPYLHEDFVLTARAYNPASGATATSAALVAWQKAPQASTASQDTSGTRRRDTLISVETAAGQTYTRLLRAGKDVPPATQVSRIIPLAKGRFALLIRSTRRYQPFSAIVVVDPKGAPLRQTQSDSFIINDLVMGADGDLYAVGHTEENGTRYGLLRRYRVNDL